MAPDKKVWCIIRGMFMHILCMDVASVKRFREFRPDLYTDAFILGCMLKAHFFNMIHKTNFIVRRMFPITWEFNLFLL